LISSKKHVVKALLIDYDSIAHNVDGLRSLLASRTTLSVARCDSVL